MTVACEFSRQKFIAPPSVSAAMNQHIGRHSFLRRAGKLQKEGAFGDRNEAMRSSIACAPNQTLAAPFASICAPETQLASGDARNAITAATSSARPMRLKGEAFW